MIRSFIRYHADYLYLKSIWTDYKFYVTMRFLEEKAKF